MARASRWRHLASQYALKIRAAKPELDKRAIAVEVAKDLKREHGMDVNPETIRKHIP